jgi:hypothetical protein
MHPYKPIIIYCLKALIPNHLSKIMSCPLHVDVKKFNEGWVVGRKIANLYS